MPIINATAPTILKTLNKNDFLVGTAVVMSEQKGLKYLVEAAGKVVREVPQIKFLLIGDGPQRKELEQQVAEYGLSENIIFLFIL